MIPIGMKEALVVGAIRIRSLDFHQPHVLKVLRIRSGWNFDESEANVSQELVHLRILRDARENVTWSEKKVFRLKRTDGLHLQYLSHHII